MTPVNPKSNLSQSTGTIPNEPGKLSIQPIQEHIIQAVSGENMQWLGDDEGMEGKLTDSETLNSFEDSNNLNEP